MNIYPFIEAEKAQRRNVKRACALLKVSRAAFYAHRSGPSRCHQRAWCIRAHGIGVRSSASEL